MPAAQLMIAFGIPLHRIKAVRRMFGASNDTMDPIDFRDPNRPGPEPAGYVIAARWVEFEYAAL